MMSELPQSTDTNNTARIQLIYEDATKSVDVARETFNQLSSRLSLLLGFEAAFTSLSLNLPSNNLCIVVQQTHTYFRRNTCLVLKVLAIAVLCTSIITTLLAIWPKSQLAVIKPDSLLIKTQSLSVNQLRQEMINLRILQVNEFQKEITYRANRLKWSLVLLGSAAIVTALDILFNTLLQPGPCKF